MRFGHYHLLVTTFVKHIYVITSRRIFHTRFAYKYYKTPRSRELSNETNSDNHVLLHNKQEVTKQGCEHK